MKRTLPWALPVLALATLLALALGPATANGEEKADAKKLFVETHKCNMCHGVAAEDIEAKTTSDKMKGPDLSGYESDKEFAEIAAYARKEADLDGKQHKKEFKGTDEELQTILDWLGSLEAQE